MKEKTLLILAAGMGSRFGGLKQIEPVGPNDEFIIDYSVYDAIKAGFNKVVFIIKEENFEIFKETIGKRIDDKINVEYCFQDLDNLPEGYVRPNSRLKPWGTGHAILSAKDMIDGDFIIINADDFYGRDSYMVASKFMDNKKDYEYANIAYKVENTLTENGSVKRGVCFGNEDLYLDYLIESNVIKKDKILCSPLNNDSDYVIEEGHLVSMNMFCFDKNLFKVLEDKFTIFLEENKNNLDNCEFLIPEVITEMINDKMCSVKLLGTSSKWIGVTYKEDKEQVVREIQELINSGEYPIDLWVK
ncbi:MAG: sugar phosphate nucleotidyltransferase [Bacilli bacterium]|nr:sugar phosphate nucleotidyltransferase [Bacilli bacterium]